MICGKTPLYSSSSIYSVSSFTRLHIQSSLCFFSAFVATPGPVFLSSYSSHHHALHIEFSFTFSICFPPRPPLFAPQCLLSFSNILLSSSFIFFFLCSLSPVLHFPPTTSYMFCKYFYFTNIFVLYQP